MLHGVDIAIFYVPTIVLIVSDQVFPEATLPNAALAARAANLAQQLDLWDGFENWILINRQRIEKSESPSGRVQIAWI